MAGRGYRGAAKQLGGIVSHALLATRAAADLGIVAPLYLVGSDSYVARVKCQSSGSGTGLRCRKYYWK